MPVDDSKYNAELYEMVHRGTSGDLDYYVEAVAGARRVLEVGCGYGRVLQVLAEVYPDLELVGIDLHEGLLRRARARLPDRVRLYKEDMTRFQLDERFDAILAPYSTLWCLTSDEACAACFRQIREHLQPEGRFLFDAYAADEFHEVASLDDEEESANEHTYSVADIYSEQFSYHVTETSAWSPEEQSFVVRYIHAPIPPHAEGPSIEAVIRHRYLLAHQVRERLTTAGFSKVVLWDGFERDVWTAEATHLVGDAS